MAKDPLKIIGRPNPTPEERAAAEALAKQTGRPAKTCRAALLDSNHDVAKATALLNDGKFLLWNTETDDVEMMELAQRLMREQSGVPPQPPEPYVPLDVDAIRQMAAASAAYEQRAQKARGTKLKDPVLGALKWDTLWHGRANVPPFGKMLLSVETDQEPDDVATPPRDEHYRAFQAFVASAADVRAKVEKANFEYLQGVRAAGVYDDDDRELRKLKTPADVWSALSDPALNIPLQWDAAWRVELHWNAAWEEEHGHAVYIKDGEVFHVCIPGEGWPDAPAG